jgi:hypothetical protein
MKRIIVTTYDDIAEGSEILHSINGSITTVTILSKEAFHNDRLGITQIEFNAMNFTDSRIFFIAIPEGVCFAVAIDN